MVNAKEQMEIKGKNILFRVRNKETGKDGWISATEFVENIFKLHTDNVLIPLIKKYNKREKLG